MGMKEGWERFKQEVKQTLKEKFDQGRDELANGLIRGDTYMPWPGSDKPTVSQEAERSIAVQEEIERIKDSSKGWQGELDQSVRSGGNDKEIGLSR